MKGRSVILGLVGLSACQLGFQGESGFTPGRAQLVPCVDPAGQPAALLIIESASECWPSLPGERGTCEQRRTALTDNPNFCTPGLVVDSPSQFNLTAFLGTPIDPSDYRGAGAVTIRNLPCNPRGPTADGYPDFADYIETFVGEVLVTADDGLRGRLSLDLTRPDSEEPAIVGTSGLQICR